MRASVRTLNIALHECFFVDIESIYPIKYQFVCYCVVCGMGEPRNRLKYLLSIAYKTFIVNIHRGVNLLSEKGGK